MYRWLAESLGNVSVKRKLGIGFGLVLLLTLLITFTGWTGLGEVISALLSNGLRLTALEEHQSIPWEALPGQMEKGADGEWRLIEAPWRLPLSYTLQALKG